MKDQKFSFSNFLSLGFLSFFGVGYAPIMPGTMGSLATIPFLFLISYFQLSFWLLIAIIVLLFVVSSLVAEKVQNRKGVQDPSWIVIDEVIGMLITWAFIYPQLDLKKAIVIFAIFRFFDIIKIYPANVCDKKIKNGMGTILDDVISGIYAGLIVYGLNKFQLII